MIIRNAKDKPLDEQLSQLPNMSETVSGFFFPIKFDHMQKQLIGGILQEIPVEVSTFGTREPLKQDLDMLPEGQRAWIWETLRCLPDVILTVDDVIKIKGIPFRVMMKKDYKIYGYVEYVIVSDYKG